MISAAQLELLARLASSIKWRKSAADFVRSRLLAPLRRENWDGQWESLFSVEARNVIAALRRMAGHPAESGRRRATCHA